MRTTDRETSDELILAEMKQIDEHLEIVALNLAIQAAHLEHREGAAVGVVAKELQKIVHRRKELSLEIRRRHGLLTKGEGAK